MSAEETGSTFNHRERPAAADRRDLLFEALIGLHARACRVAMEVHHLLAGGFPMCALARCRTLHELAVTAGVLAAYGRQPQHQELAERFVLHQVITAYKDALAYQDNYEALGYEPISAAEMGRMKRDRDELVVRYGTNYKYDYGWAAGIESPKPDFRELERLAALSHMRSHYKWAGHEVHSGSKGWADNRVDFRGSQVHTTGPTNKGLADPGSMALVSLYQVTTTTVVSGTEMAAPIDLLGLEAISRLVDKAGDAFVHGERSVERAEQRFVRASRLTQFRIALRDRLTWPF